MAQATRSAFTDRQTMIHPDFEFYHYIDDPLLEIDYHSHDFYEIFFFISGNVSYEIEGKIYTLRPGDILLTDTRDLHRPIVKPGRKYERFVIWIRPDFIRSIESEGDRVTDCFQDADLKQYKLFRPGSELSAYLRRLCEKLDGSYENPAYGQRILTQAYMLELLVFLNMAYKDTSSDIQLDITENAKVNQVIAFINQNLSEELSLDLLAQQLHISKFYLSNQFKQYTGFTIYQYILKKRLIAARQLLRQNEPVMSACLACGFNDYSNFLKAFKREFGILPSSLS